MKDIKQFWKSQPQYLRLKFMGKERSFRKCAYDGFCRYVWKKRDARVALTCGGFSYWSARYLDVRTYGQRKPESALQELAKALRKIERDIQAFKE